MTANLFRGALGLALPRTLFVPAIETPGPSGFAQPPRPFVLRARHLDGQRFEARQRFPLTLHLFSPCADEIVKAFRQSVPLHGAAKLIDSSRPESIEVPLDPRAHAVSSATVRFLTPTELKSGNTLTLTPEFPILFARVVARLRTLAAIYSTPLHGSFSELQDEAGGIRMTSARLKREWTERRSTRTGQTHPLGGFQGEAVYQGQLGNLLPFLYAAQYTGVGRQTVWGKGELEVAATSAID